MNQDVPSAGDIIFVVASLLFVGGLEIAAIIAAVRGRDLQSFESMRAANPRYFRNLVWVCRVNGPLVCLASLAGILLMPLALLEPTAGPIWFRLMLAPLMMLASAGFLWLSWRWLRWGWQVRL